MGNDVVNFVQEFHETTILPKAMTTSFLTLIPKVHNPQELNDYRPIFLIGCMYNVVARILASRLRKVIGKLILNTQTSFIPGRQIIDGILVANEILDYAKREKKNYMMFRVDFAQAYDCVSWDYLRAMMKKLDFGVK